MKSPWHLLSVLLLLSTAAHAVVIRSDVPDAKYVVSGRALPALADLPYEGHGTLIAKRWVVTAAHAVAMMRTMPDARYVTLAGIRRKVSRIVVHPDYPTSAANWNRLMQHMASGDAAEWMERYASIRAGLHDIALLELAEPVEDVMPVRINLGHDEPGRVSGVFGKGATGTSVTGTGPHAPHRTERAGRPYTGTGAIVWFPAGGTWRSADAALVRHRGAPIGRCLENKPAARNREPA